MSWFRDKKKKPPVPKKSYSTPIGGHSSNGSKSKKNSIDPLDKQIMELMDQLSIPKSGRNQILKLPKEQKKMMLDSYKRKLSQTARKPKQSGKDWSNKFTLPNINWKLLKEFEVLLNDSTKDFSIQFIQELGLKRLCRVSQKNNNTQFDTQILLIFKAIIDTSQTIIKDFISSDDTITTIVSKVDSDDNRVRGLAIKLLVTLVVIEDDDLSLLASSKIMSSLLDSARLRGYRNRWKSVITHLSVNELSGNGSYEYDNYALMLINFIVSGLESVEERTDERRLLNSLKFRDVINKLNKSINETMQSVENDLSNRSPKSPTTPITSSSGNTLRQRERRMSSHQFNLIQYQYCQSVQTQLIAYNNLREEDIAELKQIGVIDDENDLSSPTGLFKIAHDQALDDGFINELSSILKNLITIPSTGEQIWINCAKIVSATCKPMQNKYKTPGGTGGGLPPPNNNSNDNTSATYMSYNELKHLLKVQATEEEKEKSVNNKFQEQLDEERAKVNQLETQIKELQKAINERPAAIAAAGAAPVPVVYVDDGLDKFRKMVKMKIPKQAIINKMKFAKIDIKIIQKYELTGNLPDPPPKAPSAIGTGTGTGTGTGLPPPNAPLPDDGLDKYRKMIKMKIPKQAIMNKMKQNQVDVKIIQQYELTGQLPGGASPAPAPAPAPIPGSTAPAPAPAPAPTPVAPVLTKEEEIKLAKYLRMKKMNLPEQVIRNKMKQDGIDKSLRDKMFGGGNTPLPPNLSTLKSAPPKPKWPVGLNKKPLIKPSRKMKNFQWKAIDPFKVSSTIWNEVDDTKIKFNNSNFENMFGQKIIATKHKRSGSKSGGSHSVKPKKQQKETISLLDGKRSYGISLYLGGLKLDGYKVKKILLNMDESKFNYDTVSKLKKFVPTPSESQLFDGLDQSDCDNLAKPEMFFNILRNIDKNLPQRLELWAFKMEFNKVLAIEIEKINALKNAIKCIKTSKSLRQLFSIILAFGNYMNGGTKKGQSHGFSLNSLGQLTRSKSTDNRVTLMEYLYEYLLKNSPSLLEFTTEWSPLENAIRIDIPTLRSGIAQINGKLNIISGRLKNASTTNTVVGDKFVDIMKPFHSDANSKFSSIKKEFEKTMKDLYDLACFLNEDRDRTGVYLKTLNDFRKQFIWIKKQSEEKKKRAQEKAKHAKWKAERNKAKNKNRANNKPPSTKKKLSSKNISAINESASLDDQKNDNTKNNKKPPPPPPGSSKKRKNPTVFGGNNKSDQMLAALMQSDSSAVLKKLKARRKKVSSAANK